tara:strand:+ start:379 stop:960 length:582 start_codon:yes stop_codon:yes gene_type:complete
MYNLKLQHMDALENIILRNSPRVLTTPFPSKEQMDLVYKAAFRAPDHAWLRPSRFIQVTGESINKLSKIFEKYASENIEDIDQLKLEKYKQAPFRAPMIIIIISNITDHPKVPEIEQMLSTAAAAQNILLALNAINFAGMWRTGALALNDTIGKYLGLEKQQRVLGYLYVGTPEDNPKRIPEIDINDFVTKWD